MICKKCGREASLGAVFCDFCGNRFDDSLQSYVQPAAYKQKSNHYGYYRFYFGLCFFVN